MYQWLRVSACTKRYASETSDSSMSSILDIEPPPGSIVRFISDLHLGHERCEAPTIATLESILQGISTLVILGDAAETRQCDWQSAGKAAREELRSLCRAQGVQLVEIAGNHDPDIPALLVRLWGGRVIGMHGHALYKEGAPWSWEYLNNKEACHRLINSFPEVDSNLEQRLELSRQMCQLTPPIMKRKGIRNPLLRGFMHCFWPPQRPMGIVWTWITSGWLAEQFARQFLPQAEVLIFGHMHRSGHWKYGKRHIFNTGAWFRHATPYVVDMCDTRVIAYRKAKEVLKIVKN